MSGSLLLAIALFAGPCAGVGLVLFAQRQSQRYERRLTIFNTMLRNRRRWLSPEWVGALNLAVIEFRTFPSVIAALAALSDKFSDSGWMGSEQQRERAVLDVDAAVSAVLQHMADALRIDIAASDLRARNWSPAGWSPEDMQDRLAQSALVQLLRGERPLRVDIGRSEVALHPTLMRAIQQPHSSPAAPDQPAAAE